MQTISKLGLGTLELTGSTCEEVVQSALSLGYTHIDTAQIYGNEEAVGRAVKDFLTIGEKTREELWITTKVWIDNYTRLEDSLQESLEKLQTDYVDLLLLHRPTTMEQHEQCLTQMLHLQEVGKIRQIGVSNFTLHQLEHAWKYTHGRIYTNQIEYHPCLRQEIITSFCDEKGIKVTAYSPLGHGNLLKNQSLQIIADKYGVSIAQVCIAWLLQQGCVVIPKTSNRKRLQENFDAQDLVLDNEDLEIIANLPKNHRYINPPFAPKWDC